MKQDVPILPYGRPPPELPTTRRIIVATVLFSLYLLAKNVLAEFVSLKSPWFAGLSVFVVLVVCQILFATGASRFRLLLAGAFIVVVALIAVLADAYLFPWLRAQF